MLLGAIFPNLAVETSHGFMKLYDYQGSGWLIFFSHPADFTPVCTTELARVVKLGAEFDKRGCKMIALSCDSVEDHKSWSWDVMAYAEQPEKPLPYPIIADPKREIAMSLGMLDPVAKDKTGLPLTCRAVFIIGPDHTLRLSLLYPATTGRNFDEILRVIDSLQLTSAKKVATPVDWQPGQRTIVPPSQTSEGYPDVEAVKLPSGKQYLRFTTIQ